MQYNLIYSVSFNKEFLLQPTRFIWQSTHGLSCAVWETCCWMMQISRVVPAGLCFPFSYQDLGHERCSLPTRADLTRPLILIISSCFLSLLNLILTIFHFYAGDLGSIPGLGRSPGGKKGHPLQYSGLENSMDCIVHVVTKSRTWLSDFQFHFHFPAWFIFCLFYGNIF